MDTTKIMMHVNDSESECRVNLRVSNLEQIDVWINHGVAKVGLHVSHGLSFYLEPIPHPHIAVDL